MDVDGNHVAFVTDETGEESGVVSVSCGGVEDGVAISDARGKHGVGYGNGARKTLWKSELHEQSLWVVRKLCEVEIGR